jgi:hypothetical protein
MANPVALPEPPRQPPYLFIAITSVLTITVVGLVVYLIIHSKKNKRRIAKETIEFNIDQHGGVIVKGYYSMKLEEGKNDIFYPLPNATDSLLNAHYEGSDPSLSFTHSHLARYEGYLIPFKPGNGNLTVTYKSRPNDNSFRYILLSTRFWKSPVGKAEFIIRTPKEALLKTCNFKYSCCGVVDGKNEYKIAENDLWPEKDLIFSWQ